MACPAWLTSQPIAHRGLHDLASGVPENTLLAAQAAIDNGYSIEVDIQPSAEGCAMVFHDTSLERLTIGSGPVAAQPAATLTSLHVAQTSEQIPTLDDLLNLVAGRVPLILEIKSENREPGPFEATIAFQLANYRGEVALMSFDPATVAAIAGVARLRPRGLISYAYDDDTARRNLRSIQRWSRRNLFPIVMTSPDFIAYDARALPCLAATLIRRMGFPLIAWTVRSVDDQCRLEPHVDQIVFEGFIPETAAQAY